MARVRVQLGHSLDLVFFDPVLVIACQAHLLEVSVALFIGDRWDLVLRMEVKVVGPADVQLGVGLNSRPHAIELVEGLEVVDLALLDSVRALGLQFELSLRRGARVVVERLVEGFASRLVVLQVNLLCLSL